MEGEGVPQEGVDEGLSNGLQGGCLAEVLLLMVTVCTADICRTKRMEKLLGRIWSPEQAIYNFKQLEKFHGDNENPKFHGYKGRINIRQAPFNPPYLEKLVSAIVEATGVDKILDYNDPTTPFALLPNGNYFKNQLDSERVHRLHFCLLTL